MVKASASHPRLSNVLVLDNGASTIKAGFATRNTDLSDCSVIPNCIARSRDRRLYVGKQLENCKDFGSIVFRQPVEKGYIVNWESQKEIWDRLLLDDESPLKCDAKTTTLILTEAPNAPTPLQTNVDQIVFEEYEFGAYYRCPAPQLVAWNDIGQLFNPEAPAQHNAAECVLVVDCGYSFTHVIPVINGKPYQAGVRRIDVGGKVLTNYLKEMFSIRQLNMMDETYIVNEIKESCCYVSTDPKRDLDICKLKKRNNIVKEYVLPDYKNLHKGLLRDVPERHHLGKDMEQTLIIGNERFMAPELLFHPGDVGYRQSGLSEVIMKSVESVPELYKALLLANIVLIGGNALLRGLKERLEAELIPMAPEDHIVRINIPEDPIKFAWQGGVALGNNKTALEQHRITRADYQEHGSAWLAKRMLGQQPPAIQAGGGATMGSNKRRRSPG
ncbi:Actin- protein 6 [Orbilia blumenaviensis]|uniref:Actin-like protein ARP6 n=1 Tax=Orbilia blumenaviensis TaxID=1796055 RepID=A0AAV9V763_9PEZI